MPLVHRRPPDTIDIGRCEAEPLADLRDPVGLRRGEPLLVDARGDHRDMIEGDAVILADELGLLLRRGDDVIAVAVDEELLLDAFGKPIDLFPIPSRALHVLALPRSEGMRRVDVGDAHLLGDALPRPARVPVVAVDDVVAEAAAVGLGEKIRHEIAEMAMHVLLPDEVLSSEGNAPDPQVRVDLVELGLAPETPGHQIDLVAEAGETFGEFEDEHDLASGVGLSQLGLRGDVAVDRDKEQVSVGVVFVSHKKNGWG
jgi:hypothetical protein